MKKKSNIYRVMFRRKREGRTNYKKRLKMLASKRLRLVIRKSLKNIQANLVEYDAKGDKVIISAHSSELKKLGWNYNCGNISAAYLTGLLLGQKAKKKGINDFILDIGLNVSIKGSKIYAVLAGILDSGLNIAHNPKILPDKERITGKHIADFASKIKDKKEQYDKQFSGYNKNNVNPIEIVKSFEDLKNKISGGK